MNKNILIIVGIPLLLVLVAAFIFIALSPSSQTTDDGRERNGIAGEPKDIILDFYSAWQRSREGNVNDDEGKNPLESQALSNELKSRLAEYDRSPTNNELDPVLCQNALPNSLKNKTIYEKDDSMQIMIFPADKNNREKRAVVTIEAVGDLWEIVKIDCSLGEVPPERGEFPFDNTGFLLKDSLPDTFDSNFWYIVYEDDGLEGFTAKLIFGDQSICTNSDGNEAQCDPNTLTEAMSVQIQGDMSEAGVEVAKVQVMQ